MQVKSKHASFRLHYQEERLPMWEQESDSDRRKRHRYPFWIPILGLQVILRS